MALGAASGQLEKVNAGMIRLGLTNAGAEDWVERSETRHYGAVGQYDLTSIPDGKLNTILEILSLASPVVNGRSPSSPISSALVRLLRPRPPSPRKPKASIAQVEGSGMGEEPAGPNTAEPRAQGCLVLD